MVSKKFKRCPRCNKKLASIQPVCDRCGLVFSRLERVSNSAGRDALERGESNKVIFTTTFPPDVNKWQLFWLSLFLGWLGLQFERVGRRKLYIYQIVSTLIFVAYSVLFSLNIITFETLNQKYIGLLVWAMIFPVCFGLIIWVGSTLQILFGNFKVPVAIDENIVINEYDKQVASEILSEVKNKNIKSSKIIYNKKINVVCKSCGESVKVYNDEHICPKCDESLEG